MFDATRIRSAAVGLALLGAFTAAPTEAAEVAVAATDATVTMVDGIVNARFRVVATNGETADVTGLVVAFPGGSNAVVGDVLAGGTAASGVETLTYDASQTPTKAQTVRVTLKYSVGGQAVEQAASLNLPVQD